MNGRTFLDDLATEEDDVPVHLTHDQRAQLQSAAVALCLAGMRAREHGSYLPGVAA